MCYSRIASHDLLRVFSEGAAEYYILDYLTSLIYDRDGVDNQKS